MHALEAGEAAPAADAVAPKFTELALLLQESVAIYGRNVDCLYQHVLDVSESLQAPPEAAEEARASPSTEPVAGPSSGRPARRAAVMSGLADFQRITFAGGSRSKEYCPAANRPHRILPYNPFEELAPRVLTAASWGAIYDYDNEFIGLPDDFAVTIDICHSETGMLVDNFEPQTLFDPEGPRPVSMWELQEAIDAAINPSPPSSPLGAGPSSPLRTSTPLPGEDTALDQTAAPEQTVVAEVSSEVALQTPVKRERKRRHSVINMDDIFEGGLKININEDLRQQLVEIREFGIPTKWIKRIVQKRKSYILSERWRLRELNPDPRAEFAGWSLAEATEAAATVKSWRALEPDSDDVGLFEQSSVGDGCDTSRVDDRSCADDTTRVDDTTPADDTRRMADSSQLDADWASWQQGVKARAAAVEARGALDVHALGRSVLRALSDQPQSFDAMLFRTARTDQEVSHVLLATLFLANAGNVRVVPDEPSESEGFSLQLLSDDERLYSPAAAANAEQFLR